MPDVNVGSFYELAGRDAKPSEEVTRNCHACVSRLVFAENHLQLDEMTQLVDAIEMYTSPANQEECTAFLDSTDLAVSER